MSTESKRRWREKNPDRSAEYERNRAQARRDGSWLRRDEWADAARAGTLEQWTCRSSDSYYRYERTAKRIVQKMNHARWGPDWRTLITLSVREQVPCSGTYQRAQRPRAVHA